VRVLVVNWQDIENPQAGGAEIHLHEIFGRLTKAGHQVTLLCGGWPGAPATAQLDGMDVFRAGTRYTFPFHARALFKRLAGERTFDVIVEDINKVPLYTPRWVRNWGQPPIPVVALVPHLFGDTVFQEAPLPLASVVWMLERPIPRVYGGVPFQAISESTADDLAARGIPREHIAVIYCGIDTVHYTPAPELRAPHPTFAYLGRLKRYKRVDLIIRALRQIEGSTLEIAGSGDDRPRLEQLTASLDLTARVKFLGRISEEDKLHLLRRSWALVFTSPKEGWGITNLEAAACGTPVVASNSPGIRESVRDGETGFLVPHGDVNALAAAMQRLAQSPRDVAALGAKAREFARGFTWERAASETAAHLTKVVQTGG
jgi:glycosyltransferase involved in cell wall biosynthesis